MKNKKNIKKQKVYKIRRISAVVLIVLGIFLLIFGVQRRNKIQKLAVGENALEIGGSDLDLSQVLGEEPNPPLLGAGMIPIKWDENQGMWVITTANDKDWYNYSEGKWANVMLSNRQIFI